MASSRVIMRIEVSPGVQEALADMTQQVGSTQVSVASRLLEWFVEQPEVIQAVILGLYPADIRKELPRLILERVAKGGDGLQISHAI